MKLHLNLKNKEASFDANIEGVIEKKLEYDSKNPNKKTRYQIKQEEKRKNTETKVKNPKRKTRFQIKQEEIRKTKELEYNLRQSELRRKEDLKRKRILLTFLIIIGFISFMFVIFMIMAIASFLI